MNTDRPSTIGEILDRAISTYLRRFLPLFVIMALVVVPIAIVQSLATPGLTHLFDLFNQLIHVPPGDPAATQRIVKEFQDGNGGSRLMGLVYIGQFLVIPLANTAMVIFAAAALDGAPLTIKSAYKAATARWAPQIVVGLALIAMIFGLVFAFAIVAVIVALIVAGVYAISHAVGIVLAVILGIVAFIVLLGLSAMVNVTWLMATVSVSIEEPNPIRAIGNGLRRTLQRALLRRTLLIALTILAISWFGQLAFLSFAAVLAFALHSDIVAAVVSSVGGVVVSGVCMILVLIYMRDIQLRREGSDLLLLATGESAPQA